MIAGYAAKTDSWIRFRKDWQSILKKYSVPYFHFREFADASAVARNIRSATSRHANNPYFGWRIERLDGFLLELARVVAAGSKVPVGGYVDTRRYAEHVKRTPEEQQINPHQGCIWWFYESVIDTVKSKWPGLQWPMTFVFDQTENVEWRNAIAHVHNSYQKRNSRIRGIAFADKKKMENYPLQAADMLAYHLRQIAGKYCKYDRKLPDSLPKFDRILFGKYGKEQFGELFPV